MTVRYNTNTAEDTDELWEILLQTHKRDLNSEYTIIVSSLGNMLYRTRYHLRACEDAQTTRNGQTIETVEGNAKLKSKNTTQIIHGSYNVEKKEETYHNKGFPAISVYMGVYSAKKYGNFTTITVAKTMITVGATNTVAGGVISFLIGHVNFCVGLQLSLSGMRGRFAQALLETARKETLQSLVLKQLVATQINQTGKNTHIMSDLVESGAIRRAAL